MNSKQLKAALLETWQRCQQLELDIQALVASIPPVLPQGDVPDLVDCGYMLREVSNIFETLRKATRGKQELVARVLAAMASAAALKGDVLALEGEMARATADVSSKPKIPATGTPEFVRLMQWLGLSDDQIARNVFRPSFRALTDEINKRMAAGERLPPGITSTFQEMMATFVTKLKGRMKAEARKADSDDDNPF